MGGCGGQVALSTNTRRALRLIHMLYPQLEEKLDNARRALKRATSENIIELCKQYLVLLAEYRSELYKLPGTPRINARGAVRMAVDSTTQERNKTEALLRSFITVSGYQAVETLNRRKYRGVDNWELRAGGVKFTDSACGGRMTVQEAVDAASLLRREEQIARNAAESAAEPDNVPWYF